MKLFMIMLAGVLLAACANVQGSNPRSVTISAGAALGGQAQEMANAECAKYGRYARFAGKASMWEFVYDCVQ
jgi:hypothetical protein